MSDDLEERLRSHARSFDSLLSLIPAKVYYGEDVSDQWQRKKQTPEQKRAAKMAKLDPDNWKSAKDVMDERAAEAALKRKREQTEAESDDGMVASEKPKSEQDLEHRTTKKRRTDESGTKQEKPATTPSGVQAKETDEERRQKKIEKQAAKRERKRLLKSKLKEKQERHKERKKAEKQATSGKKTTKPLSEKNTKDNSDDEDGDQDEVESADDEMTGVDINIDTKVVLTISDPEASSSTTSDNEEPAIFSPPHESAGSSISSTQTGLSEPANANSKTNTLQSAKTSTIIQPSQPSAQPQDSTQTPKERLQAALNQFRTERKADGIETKPAKNRQELLEQRRKKEAERKAAKKEQKRREREEQARKEDEEIARRFSPGGSGSLLASPRSPQIESDLNSTSHINDSSFTYGRIAFSDGSQLQQISSNPTIPTSTTTNPKSKTSVAVNDTLSHLRNAESKKSRLSNLSDSQRSTIEQKDMWLNAKKKAHGERVRDDTSLLKKTLKRQQSAKKKSEKEWTDRKQSLEKAQAAKQKRRNENLANRKNEKGASSGSNKGKAVKGKGKANVKKRPGFEGSFRARTSNPGKSNK